LFDGAAEVSGKMTIICNPYIKICMFEEPNGHQTRNMSALHGRISLNGPNVHVLLGSVDISTQTGNERLHRPHKQHVFDEQQIQFRR
jgi:hypothetical protein